MNNKSIISSNANIGVDVNIGPFCVIEDDVTIGSRTNIRSHVIIKSGTIIGEDCDIYSGAILGEQAQDLKYKNEKTILTIGNNNIVREFCTMHRGTIDRIETKIGDNCMFMAYSHIAHDAKIGDNVILSNGVQVGGHVDIENNVIVGGATPIHQFCKLGEYSFVGGGYRIVQDIPPYIKAMGEPLRYAGINSLGLSRNNFEEKVISSIKKAYKIIYRSEYNISQALDQIRDLLSITTETKKIINFIKNSSRGII